VSIEGDFRTWAATAMVRLRRTAYLLCGDWHQADDLVQETLIRVYASWSRVRDPAARDAYATTTLVNRFRTSLRRGVRRELARAPEDLPDVAGPSPLEPPDGRLLEALAGLGSSQREIVVLRYWEDYSVAETARILGISTGTVTSQSSRALATLRHVLAAPSLETSGDLS